MEDDLWVIVRQAIDGASAGRAVQRTLADRTLPPLLSSPLHVVAAGKAASSMAAMIAAETRFDIKTIFAAGTHAPHAMPHRVEWHECAHPVPDARSVVAARRALDIAAGVAADECLVILLSGGASAVMAAPADGLQLEDKQQTIRAMLLAGADIHALNTVRKHLSAIKGGRLAAACRGTTLTLAVSDVIGDDLSVIGSGPGVPDASTWADASRALQRYGGPQHAARVFDYIDRGVRGEIADTLKPGSPSVARTSGHVIASRSDALAAARSAAESLGYRVILHGEDIAGEAREAAREWFRHAVGLVASSTDAVCVISAGETTVQVTGDGRGGRNQEFALALVGAVASQPRDMIAASVGSDGIDGPTDAAGAFVDGSSHARAQAMGLEPRTFLERNNSYEFFDRLGNLIRLGRTDTNVGDLQILLAR